MVALFRRRRVRIGLAICAGLGALSPLLPLCNVPGYESALLANVLAAMLGGALGIAAVRQERELEEGVAVDGLAPSPAALTSVLRATFAAFGLTLAALAVTLLAAVVAGAIGAACSVTRGLPWYPVLVLPSALLASALGVLAGALVRGRRMAGLLYGGFVLVGLSASLWPVLMGPQVFVYDHLLGYLPGPLYDETVELVTPLVVYRLLTLGWAALALGFTALTWRAGRVGRPRRRPVAAALFGAGLSAVIAGHVERTEIGYEATEASVAEKLGGRTEGDACTLIHPREMKVEDARRTARECDLRVQQLESFFGDAAPRPTVYLYRSGGEKQHLVGAGGTQYAKPWLHELHVSGRGWPQPVLKHELAHLVAGPLGAKPFGVTAVLGGLFPVQGLVEGAAVAADWPPGDLTVHEEARAMEELKLAPPLPSILGAFGFYGESAGRAYTYAGSFVRWLMDTRGSERFARLYRDGDFQAAYGAPLPELVEQWKEFLKTVPLSARGRELAERRFHRPAIFRRPCAREVAELSEKGDAALDAEDDAKAAELYGRCAALDPGDPAHLRAVATAFARKGDVEKVRELAAEIDHHHGADAVLRGQAAALVGDALAVKGERSEAAQAYRDAASLPQDDSAQRMLAVKIETLADPDRAAAVMPYLLDGDDARLFAVRDLLEKRPDWTTGWYLVGRRLEGRGRSALAASYLDHALAGPLPTPGIEREAHRLHALALMRAGRAGDACPELAALAEQGDPGPRLEASDLLALCKHEQGIPTAAR